MGLDAEGALRTRGEYESAYIQPGQQSAPKASGHSPTTGEKADRGRFSDSLTIPLVAVRSNSSDSNPFAACSSLIQNGFWSSSSTSSTITVPGRPTATVFPLEEMQRLETNFGGESV